MTKIFKQGRYDQKTLDDFFQIDQYSGGTIEHTAQYVERLINLNVALLDILMDKGVLSNDDINQISRKTLGYELGHLQKPDEDIEIDDPRHVLQGNDSFEYVDGKWRMKK